MKSIFKVSAIVAALTLATGCTRIETGEVGLRVGFDKQVSTGELLPGSFNQTFIGNVLTFPIKEISVKVEDMTPLAKDNSTMKDFDTLVTYNINQAQVAEIYNSKNRSFHAVHDGDVVAQFDGFIQVVAHKHDGFLEGFLQLQQFLLQVLANQRVQGGKGLVHQQNVSVGGKRTRQAHALLHAAGEFMRVFVGPFAQAHQFEFFGHHALALGF